MPTWRSYLKTDEDFLNSDYFKRLNSFLNNEKLIEMNRCGQHAPELTDPDEIILWNKILSHYYDNIDIISFKDFERHQDI